MNLINTPVAQTHARGAHYVAHTDVANTVFVDDSLGELSCVNLRVQRFPTDRVLSVHQLRKSAASPRLALDSRIITE